MKVVRIVATAIGRLTRARVPLVYGPADEPWGGRCFFARDPFGKLLNILQHQPAG